MGEKYREDRPRSDIIMTVCKQKKKKKNPVIMVLMHNV